MLNSSASFSLSNNHGMRDDIIARIVDVTVQNANVTGIGRRAIVANPGCKLIFAQKDGTYQLSSGIERNDISLLRLNIMEHRNVKAIEIRVNGFFVDLPITIDHGYNHDTLCDDKVSYTAHCLTSVQNEQLFLSTFSLSASNPKITTAMITAYLAKGAIILAGNYIDEMGKVNPRSLYSLFNAMGLYLHGSPVITDYLNTRAQHLRQLQEAYDGNKLKLIGDIAQAEVDLTKQSLATLPTFVANLIANGLEPDAVEQAVESYLRNISNGRLEINKSYDRVQQAYASHVAESERKSGYSENRRPDRIAQREAARLCASSNNNYRDMDNRPNQSARLQLRECNSNSSYEPRRGARPQRFEQQPYPGYDLQQRFEQPYPGYGSQQRFEQPPYPGRYGSQHPYRRESQPQSYDRYPQSAERQLPSRSYIAPQHQGNNRYARSDRRPYSSCYPNDYNINSDPYRNHNS